MPELSLKDPYAIGGLGFVAYYAGEYAKAVPLLEQAVALAQETGRERTLAEASGQLGTARLELGDYVEASACLAQSLAILLKLREKSLSATYMYSMGKLALRRGDPKKAARLLGTAEVLRQGTPVTPVRWPD